MHHHLIGGKVDEFYKGDMEFLIFVERGVLKYFALRGGNSKRRRWGWLERGEVTRIGYRISGDSLFSRSSCLHAPEVRGLPNTNIHCD